ncbi:MAG: rhomboid family intramembrane serine protease [Spirochaetales bacterium]|nr:rhomboid family intramembrane serine protease [Spirochaetales bacterium]
MKIRYNAPVILTFSLACTAVYIVSQIVPGFNDFFSVPGNSPPFNFLSLEAVRLVSYTLGHGSWEHLIGNLSIILLAGPILEEKYGPVRMFAMILITALAAGVFNVLVLPWGSLGASGIAFMLILLISVTNVKQGEIPLTLVAIIAIYVSTQVIEGVKQMSQPQPAINVWAHLLGGFCGGVFGFFFAREKKKKVINDMGDYRPPTTPHTLS